MEAGGLGQGQEDEEYLEEFVELLLLEVDGTLLLEVELDYGVQGLEGCFFRLVLDAPFVLCHGWKLTSSLVLVPTRTSPHFFARVIIATPILLYYYLPIHRLLSYALIKFFLKNISYNNVKNHKQHNILPFNQDII